MKVKKIPLRTCLGCRQSFPKKELLRVVKNAQGGIGFDITGRANGRGAYLCKKQECLAACLKSKALNRAFETNVPPEVYEQLKARLAEVLVES